MLSHLVMTVISPDRPGLVELVADKVAAHGGNWLESRMSRLGGQFAGLIRVEVAGDQLPALLTALRELETSGLRIVTHTEATTTPPAQGTLVHLELVGHDRPGILLQVTRVLAQHKVNVEDLTSERVSAPIDGNMLFQAKATLLIPPSTSLAALRNDIERIAGDLMADVRLQAGAN